MGLFHRKKKEFRKLHEETITRLKDIPKKEQIKTLKEEIEEELAKLPKKMQKRARKLADMAIKGQILIPNENVDNKKLIQDNR